MRDFIQNVMSVDAALQFFPVWESNVVKKKK